MANGRTIELSLKSVYVQPRLMAESQRAPEAQRERQLLALLDDPDSDEARYADWERELNALKGSLWNTYHPLPAGWNWRSQLPILRDDPAPLELAEVLRAHRHIAIVSAPGSGKSTLLRWVAVQCAYSYLHPQATGDLTAITDDTPFFPVLLPLTSYASELASNPSLSLKQFLERSLTSLGMPYLERLFADEWAAGRCWILLDGVDEIKSPLARGKVVQRIETLLAACGTNRYLLSSRLYGYERVSGVPLFYLRGFDSDQIGSFVHYWNWSLELELRPNSYDLDEATQRARGLVSQLNESKALLPLAANPLILVAMLLLHEQQRELPKNRVELYEATVQTLFETWNRWRSEALYDAGG